MINLKDKLSHLTYRQVCKLLGSEGEPLGLSATPPERIPVESLSD